MGARTCHPSRRVAAVELGDNSVDRGVVLHHHNVRGAQGHIQRLSVPASSTSPPGTMVSSCPQHRRVTRCTGQHAIDTRTHGSLVQSGSWQTATPCEGGRAARRTPLPHVVAACRSCGRVGSGTPRPEHATIVGRRSGRSAHCYRRSTTSDEARTCRKLPLDLYRPNALASSL